MFLFADRQADFALEHIDETLRRRGPERTPGRKLCRHLAEVCAQLRTRVHDAIHPACAWQRNANECVRSLQQVVRLEAASGCSQMMQS